MQIKIEKVLSDANGGVVAVNWSMSAARNGIEIKDAGVAKFNPDPSLPDFIPFAQLTEADVAKWVSKNINPQAVEQRLNKLAPVANFVAFPWA